MTESITCPQCGRTSYNPNDVRERYCGNCHQYHDTMLRNATRWTAARGVGIILGMTLLAVGLLAGCEASGSSAEHPQYVKCVQ